jgi:hypothetical protein
MILSALSMALCFITCVLWFASGFAKIGYGDGNYYYVNYNCHWFYISRGQIEVGRSWAPHKPTFPALPALIKVVPNRPNLDIGIWWEISEPTTQYDSVGFRSAGGNVVLVVVGGHPVLTTVGQYRYFSLSMFWPFAVSLALSFPFVKSMFKIAMARIHLIRLRRAANNTFCANCGYDLRATPDRCPECGIDSSRFVVLPPKNTTNPDQSHSHSDSTYAADPSRNHPSSCA